MDLNGGDKEGVPTSYSWEIVSSSEDNCSLQADSYPPTIGAIIRQARMDKNLSQKELADRSGISKVQLCRIENDESAPSKNSLWKISANIGIGYSSLLVQAGYNNVSGTNIFLKRDGNELELERLICSIYKADSDLLDYFTDFDTIGTDENVKVLKLVLQAMRKEAANENDESLTDTSMNFYFRTLFSSLKNFILSSLTPIMESY